MLQISYKSQEHENEDKNEVLNFLRPNSSLFLILGYEALCCFVAALLFLLIHSIKLFIRGFAVVHAKAQMLNKFNEACVSGTGLSNLSITLPSPLPFLKACRLSIPRGRSMASGNHWLGTIETYFLW